MTLQYLVDISNQIDVIIVGHPARKNKFCKHVQKITQEAENYGQYLRSQWQKAKKSGLTIYDENKNRKEWSWWTAYSKDFLWESCVYFNDAECLDVQFYIKGKPEPDPLGYLTSMILGCIGQEYEGLELLDYQFTLLAIIHDAQSWQAGRELIYFKYNRLKRENLEDRLCYAVWGRLEEYNNSYDFRNVHQTIETAMLAVRAELDGENSAGVSQPQEKGGRLQVKPQQAFLSVQPDTIQTGPKMTGEMNNYNYQQFVRESRDKIASWIVDPKIKALFAEDMNNYESLWQTCRKQTQRINSQQTKFLKSPQGRKWSIENRRWEEQWEEANQIGTQEVQWSDEIEEMAKLPAPGTKGRPRTPKVLTLKWPDSPLEKFILPIKPAFLKIIDYRVLLGALHDGFTWHEGDKSQYICPDLRKKGTIVDMLFWDYMWKEPEYKPLIEEALRVVERNINETRQIKPLEKNGQKPDRAQSANNSAVRLRFTPRSVARGLETLEAYSMRKVNEEAIRRSVEQAKQDRCRQACEKCRQLFADLDIRTYWLNQAQAVMESENDWQGPYGGVGLRYEWPRDKAKVYAVMAIAADTYSGIKILPDKLRQTDFYKVNKHIDTHIANLDLATEFMSYIEADLKRHGFLPIKTIEPTNQADLGSGGEQATPKTDSGLIYQTDAQIFYNIPKSVLSKAAHKKPGEPGYLWSGTKGKRRFYLKKDIEKLSRSRQKLRGY